MQAPITKGGPEVQPKPDGKHGGRSKLSRPAGAVHAAADLASGPLGAQTLAPGATAQALAPAIPANGATAGPRPHAAPTPSAVALVASVVPKGADVGPAAAADAIRVTGAGLSAALAMACPATALNGPDGRDSTQDAVTAGMAGISAPERPVAETSPPPRALEASPASGAGALGVARQLSPAFVELAEGRSGHSVTLRLDPAGLGHVQVRIERDAAGAATVQVTAERPETLRLLVADQPQLHRALDSAGVSPEGRTLGFSLDTSPNGMSTAIVPEGGAATTAAFGGSGDDGSRGNGGHHRQGRAGTRYAGHDEDPVFIASSGWLRAGVDITA